MKGFKGKASGTVGAASASQDRDKSKSKEKKQSHLGDRYVVAKHVHSSDCDPDCGQL